MELKYFLHFKLVLVIKNANKPPNKMEIRQVKTAKRTVFNLSLIHIYKLLPATFDAFFPFPCPSVLASSAFVPTPVPIATATISIWTGNTSVSALSADSLPDLIFPTKALSPML